jgi:hypothetical protein
MGHVIEQAVSRRLTIEAVLFGTTSGHVRFVVEKVLLGQVSS